MSNLTSEQVNAITYAYMDVCATDKVINCDSLICNNWNDIEIAEIGEAVVQTRLTQRKRFRFYLRRLEMSKLYTITRRRTGTQVAVNQYTANSEEEAIKLAQQEQNEGGDQGHIEWYDLDDDMEYEIQTYLFYSKLLQEVGGIVLSSQ